MTLEEINGYPTEHNTEPVCFGPGQDQCWRDLSNFALTPIEIDGRSYPSVEHYFQACKATSDEEHEAIRTAKTPREAKKLGRQVNFRHDWDGIKIWEEIKIDVMRRALKAKFSQNKEMRALLLATGKRAIHECARYDAEWGWMNGKGRDLLGKLLMEVRETLIEEED